jgi:hypothetical protein
MADYQRFVSYIYSYPGGVKDKNVGFAKVEVVRGEIRLNINLRNYSGCICYSQVITVVNTSF